MRLELKRIARKKDYTIGKIYANGRYICDSIEDVDRGLDDSMDLKEIQAKKVYGETAIPTGIYRIKITYSSKYKKQMPLVEDVKGFEGIRIHSGNTAKDSLGCIIVGENKVKGKVINSRATYNKLFDLIKNEKDIYLIIT